MHLRCYQCIRIALSTTSSYQFVWMISYEKTEAIQRWSVGATGNFNLQFELITLSNYIVKSNRAGRSTLRDEILNEPWEP